MILVSVECVLPCVSGAGECDMPLVCKTRNIYSDDECPSVLLCLQKYDSLSSSSPPAAQLLVEPRAVRGGAERNVIRARAARRFGAALGCTKLRSNTPLRWWLRPRQLELLQEPVVVADGGKVLTSIECIDCGRQIQIVPTDGARRRLSRRWLRLMTK